MKTVSSFFHLHRRPPHRLTQWCHVSADVAGLWLDCQTVLCHRLCLCNCRVSDLLILSFKQQTLQSFCCIRADLFLFPVFGSAPSRPVPSCTCLALSPIERFTHGELWAWGIVCLLLDMNASTPLLTSALPAFVVFQMHLMTKSTLSHVEKYLFVRTSRPLYGGRTP